MKKQLFDCILQQGELDKSFCPAIRYLDNEKYKCEVVLHNVTQSEAVDWCNGTGLKTVNELTEKNPDPYFHVSAFWPEALKK